MKNRRTGENPIIVVSFSGMDGAGKSTQIESLQRHLAESGFRVRTQAFWDNIALLGKIRESSSHRLFKSEKGIGSPGKPVNRRDKNIQGWYLSLARFFLYTLDAFSLRAVRSKLQSLDADVVIFDRYLYDELANLPVKYSFTRAYVRALLKCVPSPDVAFLLDADPSQARARKPEYPIEFLERNRQAYFAIGGLAQQIMVIEPMAASEVQQVVWQKVEEKLAPHLPKTVLSSEDAPDHLSGPARAIEL